MTKAEYVIGAVPTLITKLLLNPLRANTTVYLIANKMSAFQVREVRSVLIYKQCLSIKSILITFNRKKKAA